MPGLLARAGIALEWCGHGPEELWTRKTQKAGMSTNSRQQQVWRGSGSLRAPAMAGDAGSMGELG